MKEMAGQPEDTLPDELQRWVDERVADSGEDPADVLSRAVTLYRLVEKHTTPAGEEMPPVEDIESNLEQLTDQLSDLDDRVEGLEGDLEEKITDVRERVIQVKRETDAKAPAEHDHDEIREHLDTLDGRLDQGFDNYEEILSYLTDETENLDGKLTRLAQIVVSLRRRTERVEQQVTRLDAVDDLKRSANRQGLRKAKCEECGGSVSLGLLTEPACPHCGCGFVDVEPTGRLFSSGTLVTGGPPALTAGDDPTDAEDAGQSGQESATRGNDGATGAAAEILEESKND